MAIAVVSEFNPFHNGHKYLIERAKSIKGGEVIAVMSGSFTQRGEAAVTDKFFRAKTALENGADLVLELPAVYAAASARGFAEGALSIIKSFKSVRSLAFGCETDDRELLSAASLAADSKEVYALTAEIMKTGEYYPKALQAAVRELHGEAVASVLSSPNNILALEYLRCIRTADIEPLPIARAGVSHDSGTPEGGFASASYLRGLLRSGGDISPFAPAVPEKITRPENFERALLYRLRLMSREELAALPEVSEGLENRIYDAVRKYNSVEEILFAVKTKRYTLSRLRRILTCALIGVTAEMQRLPVDYVRVLGFTKAGANLIGDCSLTAVTSVAKALGGTLKDSVLLGTDIRATDIAAIGYDVPGDCASDYLTPVIKLV